MMLFIMILKILVNVTELPTTETLIPCVVIFVMIPQLTQKDENFYIEFQ